jgi:hypothetical protein
VPSLNQLATKPYDAQRTYADVVHFVHVIVIEPHPQPPDPSPYTGGPWAGPDSTIRQPRTYGERVEAVKEIAPLLEGNQLLLVDNLVPEGANNPVWCTYGPAPNAAFLIRQDGLVDTVQLSFLAEGMEDAIDALLK